MAYMIGQAQEVIHLLFHHRFGRLSTAVDTLIVDAAISRIHMVIEYQNLQWFLLDVSRNGLWLNDQKLPKHERHLLKPGDIIAIGETRTLSFTFADDSPPVDILCQREGPGQPITKALPLAAINHMLNKQGEPAIIRFSHGGWLYETEHNIQNLTNFDWLTLRETPESEVAQWQLQLADVPEHTAPIPLAITAEVTLILKKYAEALPTRAILRIGDQEVDLDVRNHHDILLLLAYQLNDDLQLQREVEESGWVYMDELVEKLGITESLINIQIHRLRKQLDQALSDHLDTKTLVMRRRGQLRTGFKRIEAYVKEQQVLNIKI